MRHKNSDHYSMDTSHENYSTKWIENLALDEIQMEESGVINFTEHLDPSKLLEESSIELMEQLREKFDLAVSLFNNLRKEVNGESKVIKVFKISNTINDFMLFRNSLKLVIARKSIDTISLGFLSNSGGLFAARLNFEQDSKQRIHEIKAHVGPFNNIYWKFKGENVELDSLVRHYLTEFIKHSAR